MSKTQKNPDQKSVLQQTLEELIDDGILEGCTVRSYSGRGMYGRGCPGLEVSRECSVDMLSIGLMLARAAFADTVVYSPTESAHTRSIALLEKLDALQMQTMGMRSDSMGLGMIYYWPNVPYVQE